jgi:iron complex transport system ATP-binding protein
MILAAKDVTFQVNGSPLVDGLTLEVEPGEILGIVGPNGAGKSTLVNLLSGDLGPTAGEVRLHGKLLSEYPPLELARARAVLPQRNLLRFPFQAVDVVTMGRYPYRSDPGNSRSRDFDVALEMMRRTDTLDLARRTFPTLSGGEQARVSLARVLAQQTPLLLLDEPTASLDVRHQEQVMGTLDDLAAEGVAVLAVLHDLNLAARFADRLGLLAGGRLVAHGKTRDVLDSELLSEVYRQPITVIPHPYRDCPLVLVLEETAD